MEDMNTEILKALESILTNEQDMRHSIQMIDDYYYHRVALGGADIKRFNVTVPKIKLPSNIKIPRDCKCNSDYIYDINTIILTSGEIDYKVESVWILPMAGCIVLDYNVVIK